jgi:hypothetical protein
MLVLESIQCLHIANMLFNRLLVLELQIERRAKMCAKKGRPLKLVSISQILPLPQV